MKKTGVSVVIPSYNGKNIIFRLLDSIRKSDYPYVETIVVDNGSQDNTLVEGRKKYRWVKWVDAGQQNIGQTGCYNLGFAHSKKGNHIIYCDADVVIEKEMITRLVDRAESDVKIGIVTPMILYLSDKNWVNQAGADVNLITGRVKVGWGSKKDHLEARIVQNSGTVMLFKNSVVKEIGGMDNWFMCYFDSDYCLRAKKVGFDTWYEPKAIAYHDQSKDPNIWRPRILGRSYLLGRNRVLFMRRHGNMLTFSFFLPLLLVYYFFETINFGKPWKFFELLWGSIVGYFYLLEPDNFIPLPKLKNHQK